MVNFFKQLRKCFESCNYYFLKENDVEQNLIALYAFYKFYRADTSSIGDLEASLTLESDSPDHIDGVFLDEETDEDTVEVVSSYYVLDGLQFVGLEKLEDYYKDMFKYAQAARHKSAMARARLISAFDDNEYEFGIGKKKLVLNIITNYSPKATDKKKYNKRAESIKINDYTTCIITFGSEVEQSVLEIESPKEYVDYGFLTLDEENNYALFGAEKSMICNISAMSLKNLYESYSRQGLFAQNLRYYVKQAKTDSKIIDSIQNKPENFWYYNNGIIIICKNYKLNGKSLLLDEFSIINGGQTTKLIGDTDFDKDFYIQCKIVRNKYKDEKQTSQFIADVAEASNTQKPIKDKDIVANRVEQRELKAKMTKVNVFVQIKRGAVINKKVYPEPWQNTTNEELGQLLYSFFYQMPGSARNNKAAITGNEERYSLIFKKDYDARLLRDLCYIKAFYKQWQKQIVEMGKDSDKYIEGLLKNGFLFMVGVIGALVKIYIHKDYMKQIQSVYETHLRLNIINQYDIVHPIFKDNILSLKNDVFALFNFIYHKYLKEGFIDAKEDNPATVYSNFTKGDKNYRKYILKNIFKQYDGADKVKLKGLLYEPTDKDLENDQIALETYKITLDTNKCSLDDLDLDQKEVYNKLAKYRTITYKATKGMKAYNVFTNVEIATLVVKNPKSIAELIDLNILTDKQVTNYGDDVLAILNGTYTKFKLD